jgi:uncharacterized Zn finger protein
MEIIILANSSSRDEPYTVAISFTETGLSIFCNCPAGEWGKYCKHKMAVLLGDEKILYDDKQIENFNKASKWISESSYPLLVAKLRESEKELEAVKKTIKNMKEEIAYSMKEGLKS